MALRQYFVATSVTIPAFDWLPVKVFSAAIEQLAISGAGLSAPSGARWSRGEPGLRSAALPEPTPLVLQRRRGGGVAAIAIRQALRQAAAAEDEQLLALDVKREALSAVARAIGKPGRVPAAAKQEGVAGFDPAHLR